MKKLLIIAILGAIASNAWIVAKIDPGKVWVNEMPDILDESKFPKETRSAVMALYRVWHEIQTTDTPLRGPGGMGIAFHELLPAIEQYEIGRPEALEQFNQKYGNEIIHSKNGSAPLKVWIHLAKQGKIPSFATNMPYVAR
jgi:hypothetical protein